MQGVGGEGGGERAQPFRLKGPAIESIKLDAEIDATDQLEHPDQNAERGGVRHRAAARRCSRRWSTRASTSCWRRRAGASGTLEILPPEAPLVLFIWSTSRVVPVRVTEFSITEEAFDPGAQPDPRQGQPGPARDDAPTISASRTAAARIFLSYLRTREALAAQGRQRRRCSRSASPTCRDGAHAMTTDPVKLLIDAGAIPSSPFAPNSRYNGVPLGCYQRAPGDPGVAYVLRRFIPQRRDIAVAAGAHRAAAASGPTCWRRRYFGDPSCTGASPTPTR